MCTGSIHLASGPLTSHDMSSSSKVLLMVSFSRLSFIKQSCVASYWLRQWSALCVSLALAFSSARTRFLKMRAKVRHSMSSYAVHSSSSEMGRSAISSSQRSRRCSMLYFWAMVRCFNCCSLLKLPLSICNSSQFSQSCFNLSIWYSSARGSIRNTLSPTTTTWDSDRRACAQVFKHLQVFRHVLLHGSNSGDHYGEIIIYGTIDMHAIHTRNSPSLTGKVHYMVKVKAYSPVSSASPSDFMQLYPPGHRTLLRWSKAARNINMGITNSNIEIMNVTEKHRTLFIHKSSQRPPGSIQSGCPQVFAHGTDCGASWLSGSVRDWQVRDRRLDRRLGGCGAVPLGKAFIHTCKWVPGRTVKASVCLNSFQRRGGSRAECSPGSWDGLLMNRPCDQVVIVWSRVCSASR